MGISMAKEQSTHTETYRVISTLELGAKPWNGRAVKSTNRRHAYSTHVTTENFQQTFQSGKAITA